MNDDEMKNLELVEALLNRASGNEAKEESEKLDGLILSGEISTEDMEKANNEVESIRALLPLIDEDKEAEFPEYARERLRTKTKEVFPIKNTLKNEGSSLSGLFGFLKPVLTFSIVVAIGYFVYTNAPKPAQNFAALSADKFDIKFAIFDLDKINSSTAQTRGSGLTSNQTVKLVTDPNFKANRDTIIDEFSHNKNGSLLSNEESLNNWLPIDKRATTENSKPIVKILYDSTNLNIEVKIYSNDQLKAEKTFAIKDTIDEILEDIKKFISDTSDPNALN